MVECLLLTKMVACLSQESNTALTVLDSIEILARMAQERQLMTNQNIKVMQLGISVSLEILGSLSLWVMQRTVVETKLNACLQEMPLKRMVNLHNMDFA